MCWADARHLSWGFRLVLSFALCVLHVLLTFRFIRIFVRCGTSPLCILDSCWLPLFWMHAFLVKFCNHHSVIRECVSLSVGRLSECANQSISLFSLVLSDVFWGNDFHNPQFLAKEGCSQHYTFESKRHDCQEYFKWSFSAANSHYQELFVKPSFLLGHWALCQALIGLEWDSPFTSFGQQILLKMSVPCMSLVSENVLLVHCSHWFSDIYFAGSTCISRHRGSSSDTNDLCFWVIFSPRIVLTCKDSQNHCRDCHLWRNCTFRLRFPWCVLHVSYVVVVLLMCIATPIIEFFRATTNFAYSMFTCIRSWLHRPILVWILPILCNPQGILISMPSEGQTLLYNDLCTFAIIISNSFLELYKFIQEMLDFQKASVRSISGLGPPDPLVNPLVCGLGGAKFWDFLGVGGLLKILHQENSCLPPHFQCDVWCCAYLAIWFPYYLFGYHMHLNCTSTVSYLQICEEILRTCMRLPFCNDDARVFAFPNSFVSWSIMERCAFVTEIFSPLCLEIFSFSLIRFPVVLFQNQRFSRFVQWNCSSWLSSLLCVLHVCEALFYCLLLDISWWSGMITSLWQCLTYLQALQWPLISFSFCVVRCILIILSKKSCFFQGDILHDFPTIREFVCFSCKTDRNNTRFRCCCVTDHHLHALTPSQQLVQLWILQGFWFSKHCTKKFAFRVQLPLGWTYACVQFLLKWFFVAFLRTPFRLAWHRAIAFTMVLVPKIKISTALISLLFDAFLIYSLLKNRRQNAAPISVLRWFLCVLHVSIAVVLNCELTAIADTNLFPENRLIDFSTKQPIRFWAVLRLLWHFRLIQQSCTFALRTMYRYSFFVTYCNTISMYKHRSLPNMHLEFVSLIFPHAHLFVRRANMQFDSTLGFPGEGPSWSLLSANINSLNAHPHWTSWEDDVLCFQETRLTAGNITEPKQHLHKTGKSIIHGRLLENKRRKNGMSHTPHGGTAILAPTSCCYPFAQDDDITLLWTYLFDSTRWSALWVQVCPKVKLLVLNSYGYATNPEFDHLAANEDMLEKAFQIVAQFGHIPIVITGDFQSDPDAYTCVQNAKNYAGWVDPLTTTDSLGNNCRPITYSRNADFHKPEDNFSSIDAILLNPAAAAALTDMQVVYEDARQHAPIRAKFQWDRIFQRGYVLDKPAAFNLTHLPKKGNAIDTERLDICAKELWQNKYKRLIESNNDDKSWQSINDFAADVLLQSGATYNKGPKGRGHKPVFKSHVACPGQDPSGCAVTNKCAKLAKLHRFLNELEWRLGRKATCYGDMKITCDLQKKIAYLIPKISQCKWWNHEQHMFKEAISCVKQEVHHELELQKQKEKRHRISEWKQKMITATRTKKVDKCVFDWMKMKTSHPTPNLIRNKGGDIILSPIDAISEINSQWDDIFSANILHEDPEKILSTVWPYISDKHKPADIPSLTGFDLMQTAAARKNAAAPGLDGWRTTEVKALPLSVFNTIAKFFTQVENGTRKFPVNLGFVKQIILDKGGQDSPLQKRLITLLSIFVLSYTGLRFKQLQSWQGQIMPKQLFGGIKGRNMSEVFSQIQLEIDFAKQQGTDLIGLKLDKSKCFDRLIPSVTSSLFLAFGVPAGVVTFFIQLYTNLRRFLAYKEWISTTPTTAPNGLIQGCSLSLLAINVHMAVWAIFMDRIPHVNSSVFIDDSYLWAKAAHVEFLRMAIVATESWDTLIGQLLNSRKCQVWATSSASRKLAQQTWPNMQHTTNLEILGARIQLSEQLNYE